MTDLHRALDQHDGAVDRRLSEELGALPAELRDRGAAVQAAAAQLGQG